MGSNQSRVLRKGDLESTVLVSTIAYLNEDTSLDDYDKCQHQSQGLPDTINCALPLYRLGTNSISLVFVQTTDMLADC